MITAQFSAEAMHTKDTSRNERSILPTIEQHNLMLRVLLVIHQIVTIDIPRRLIKRPYGP